MKNTKILTILVLTLGLMVCLTGVSKAEEPMGTAFTYQGHLYDSNSVANGLYDFQFKLYDSNDPCTGTQLASPIDINDLDVIDGHFVVELDFGSGIFDGNAVWPETRIVRSPMGSDPAALSPLLELTPTPYALYAETTGAGHSLDAADGSPMNAVYVDDEGHVGIGTTSPGLWKLQVIGSDWGIYSDGRIRATYFEDNANAAYHLDPADSGTSLVVAGSIGIGTTNPSTKLDVVGTVNATAFVGDGSGLTGIATGDSDWTISGSDMYTGASVTGNVGIGTTNPQEKLDVNGDINISSAYKIGGDSVLSALGTENILVGIGAGANNTGLRNTFLGNYAGYSNTGGHSNTFLGSSAGFCNTTGLCNIFIGCSAGKSNTTGHDNTFIGHEAGFCNTTGIRNIFIGSSAGHWNTTGYCNTFVGDLAGRHNTTGYHNTFLGDSAGRYNTTGNYNTFVGDLAGRYNTTGIGNVFIGNQAGFNETGSNKLYIANSVADPPLIYGDFSTGKVGIGTTSPAAKLDVDGTVKATSLNVESASQYTVRVINNGSGAAPYWAGYFRSNAGGGATGSSGVWGEAVGASAKNVGGRFAASGGTENFAIWSQTGTNYFGGNVGIGTTSPEDKLEVSGGMMTLDSGPGGDITGIRIRENDDMRWTFLYKTWDAADKLYIRDEVGGRDVMTFEPTTGNVGIGVMGPTSKLHVSGDIRANNDVYVMGMDVYNTGYNVTINPSTGRLYNAGSSRRYKNDIKPFITDFSKILRAEPKSFVYKANPDKADIGFIAEDFNELGLKELVVYNKNGEPDNIKYDKISIYLLEAIKELKAENDELQEQNNRLESRLSALENVMRSGSLIGKEL